MFIILIFLVYLLPENIATPPSLRLFLEKKYRAPLAAMYRLANGAV
jgi:hypothetical protein